MADPIPASSATETVLNWGTIRALAALVGLVALLGMIYLGQSSQATVTGQRVLELQDRLEQTKRANAQIEYEIAMLTTPDKVAERARRLGFRPATVSQVIYLVVKDYPVAPVKSQPALDGTPAPINSWDAWWLAALARLGWHDAQMVEASPW